MASEQTDLGRFIRWADRREPVRAVLLTSSRAVPNAPMDVFTDYDVILVVTDIHLFSDDRAWLGDFGPVLTAYHDPIHVEDGLETAGYVTHYENGLKIDFGIWPVEYWRRIVSAPTLPDEFDAGYQVVLDKDHLTDGLKPPTYRAYIPVPPTEADYHTRIENFFNNSFYVAKFLWRDDMVAAKHLLDYFIKQEDILPMLVWRSEMDHNWSVKPGPYGRRLKKWLRPDLWAELEATYGGVGLEENWDILFRTIALYRKVAVEVGDQLGYAYPHDLDRRAVAYIQKVKNLDRQAKTFSGLAE